MYNNGQQPLTGQLVQLPSSRSTYSCSHIWDPDTARFHDSFVPFILGFPAVVAVCIVFGHVVQSLVTVRPRWTYAFVKELPKDAVEFSACSTKHFLHSTNALLVLSAIGLVLQVTVVFYPIFRLETALLVLPWVLACFLITIERPRTTPFYLLTVYCSTIISQLIVVLNKHSALIAEDIYTLIGIFLLFLGICIILRMPMRDPSLKSDDISLPTGTPSENLRSPEDNLTLWQFMTVSWMSNLIAMGKTRQLHAQDVWSLSWEFQHQRLHHYFRELRGSVVSRLLQANGIDLVILSILGIVETMANLSTPVFLNQFLRTMENLHVLRHAALTYAVLSLGFRLVATQSAVFSLWFSRRCYERSRGEMITMLYEKTLSRKVIGIHVDENTAGSAKTNPNGSSPSKSSEELEKQPASMGKILNLMRNDVYEVAQRFWEFQNLVNTPLNLVLAIVLIWKLLGWSCLIGIITVVLAQVINALVARVLLRRERLRRTATDYKLQITSQFVEAIRHLRWYGWQDAWLGTIFSARQRELNLRVVTGLWGIVINFTNTFASGMFPVVAFYAYTAIARKPLRVDIAFPALQLFSVLETSLRDIPGLITVLLNAYVAVGRIEDFMREPDKGDSSPLDATAQLGLVHASFAWPGSNQLVLHDITLSFPVGLTVVFGKVGAGKTALLQALLGELDERGGTLNRNNDMVGYCSQTPWLQSMSIRENILFAAPYEHNRYEQAIEACALNTDLANFEHGDLSNIGENGIGLSGGQRARVALARALYSRAKILLLDDPLAALDHQTAETIARALSGGPLTRSRTTVLVTHRVELCRSLANQAIEVFEGRAHVVNTTEDIVGNLSTQTPQRVPNEEITRNDEEKPQQDVAEKFIEDEHRAHGGVQASVYWEYVKAGKLKWWIILSCVLALVRLLGVAETWFLKEWGEAYQRPYHFDSPSPFHQFPSPEQSLKPWLLGFFGIMAGRAVLSVISQGFMLVIIYSAGRQMFLDVMHSVSKATFHFYDVTPVGRLMNRLTSDIGTIDGNISQQFYRIALLVMTWVSSVVIIASVTPVFLVFSFALSLTFVLIFQRFLPTSQSLRRLEMVSLSPLMSNFGALLEGLTTVRAFCAQSRFQDRVIEVVDNFQRMDHFYWSLQAWLMYRFDAMSACSTFLLTLLALYTDVSPGLTAFVLIAADKSLIPAVVVSSTHLLCKVYGRLQMDFVSVERVVELLHLQQEPPGTIDPPAGWPSLQGDIVFNDVTIRYAPQFKPALSGISFRIKAGSTTAIMGRTGSGKSTLALSLLATILPESGHILLDNIDLAKVNVQVLRTRVTFLAQDPVLFPGSMRQNLDPLEEHSDDACEAVLQRICSRHAWTLTTQIDAGGRNFSQGQRQLVGLARAVLRRSAVVILDEATASIDMETALEIQQILREELRESTVITIAHRLEAVKNADHYIVLDKGRVVAQGESDEFHQ